MQSHHMQLTSLFTIVLFVTTNTAKATPIGVTNLHDNHLEASPTDVAASNKWHCTWSPEDKMHSVYFLVWFALAKHVST